MNDMADTLPITTDSQMHFPDKLPVMQLKGAIAFPLTLTPLSVGLKHSMKLIDDVMPSNRLLLLVGQKEEFIEKPTLEQLYQVGTIAVVHQMVKGAGESYRVVAQGLERIRIVKQVSDDPYLTVEFTVIPDQISPGVETDALRRAMLEALRRM